MAIQREVDGCPTAPTRTEAAAGLACEIWDGCSSGRELRLCRHDGGHLMPEGWVQLAHAWARELRGGREGG
jgi:polyhydroxybutyrate depolymerase